MRLLLTLLILLALAGATYLYRDRIEGFIPGFKNYVWNATLIFLGLAGWLADWLKLIDWSQWLSSEHVALAGVIVGGVGTLLSWVTRRLDKNGDGVLDERDAETGAP